MTVHDPDEIDDKKGDGPIKLKEFLTYFCSCHCLRSSSKV